MIVTPIFRLSQSPHVTIYLIRSLIVNFSTTATLVAVPCQQHFELIVSHWLFKIGGAPLLAMIKTKTFFEILTRKQLSLMLAPTLYVTII